MPHVKCHVSHVICHMSCVTCHMSHVMCHMSQVMCYMSHVTCNMSPVTCHMLHITCHLSHVTFFVSHVTCQVELVGGRCVSNGAYSVNVFFKHLLFSASFSGNGCLGPSPLKKNSVLVSPQPYFILFKYPQLLPIEPILPVRPGPLEQLSGTPKWREICLSGHQKRIEIWLSGILKWSEIWLLGTPKQGEILFPK